MTRDISSSSEPKLAAGGTARLPTSSELIPVVYQQLRRLAVERLKRERPGQTLTPTALVHEAYLRLLGKRVLSNESGSPGCTSSESNSSESRPRQWAGSGQFLAAASEAMRKILVDAARRKRAKKRGGNGHREPLDDRHLIVPEREIDLLALDEALADLEARCSEKALLVKMLYFTGLSIPESAEALGVSRATAERWWAYARAWLYDRMHENFRESPKNQRTG